MTAVTLFPMVRTPVSVHVRDPRHEKLVVRKAVKGIRAQNAKLIAVSMVAHSPIAAPRVCATCRVAFRPRAIVTYAAGLHLWTAADAVTLTRVVAWVAGVCSEPTCLVAAQAWVRAEVALVQSLVDRFGGYDSRYSLQ